MVDFKALWNGVTLDGLYTLEDCIRHDRSEAFFKVLTADGERLLLKLIPEQNPEADRQFVTWLRSRHLRHENLLYLRDVGRSELAGNRYIYAVFEFPDDALAPALENGPLSEPETRAVLDAVLAGLRYLHGQGLVHGAVDPGHIFAVGEEVKLSTDALREPDDLEGHLEDVRQLGELVRTLRAPEPLDEPLATILSHATAEDPWQRWTLAEIARVLEGSPAAIPVAPAIPEPAEPVADPVVAALPEPVPPAVEPVVPVLPDPIPPAIMPAVVAIREPEPEPPAPPETYRRSAGGFPKWIIAGVAILLFSILLFNLRRKPAAEPDIRPVTPVAQAVTKPIAPPAPILTAPPQARGMWRVIAFTFHSRDMAAKKAKQIDAKWPTLSAAVFAPKGRRGYYLVSLGDGMSREEAVRVQRKARSLGLPRDIYVQNYSE